MILNIVLGTLAVIFFLFTSLLALILRDLVKTGVNIIEGQNR